MIKYLLISFINKTKRLFNLEFKSFYYYFSIFLGISLTVWFLYNRFIRFRSPKDIPLQLTKIWFYILLYVCCIYLYIAISLLFPKKQNPFITKSIEFLYSPLTNFDTYWKTSNFIQPYYMTIMSNLISYLNTKSAVFKHIMFILFQIFPRAILIITFSIDIFWFHKLFYIYKFILLGGLPLLHRYIKYSLKVYKDHLIYFAKENHKYILIIDDIRLIMGSEPNPEAIYDGYRASIEEYINIVSQNIKDIKNKVYEHISLDSDYNMKIADDKLIPTSFEEEYIPLGIFYSGGVSLNDKLLMTYLRRFFNLELQSIDLESKGGFFAIISTELTRYYRKLFLLQDIILLYNNIISKKSYTYIKIFIFSVYFVLWTYLIIKSYHNIPNFNLTTLLLEWLSLYIPEKDPFSEIILNENIITFIEKDKSEGPL